MQGSVYMVLDPHGHDIKLNSFIITLQNLIATNHRKNGQSKNDLKLTELVTMLIRYPVKGLNDTKRFDVSSEGLLSLISDDVIDFQSQVVSKSQLLFNVLGSTYIGHVCSLLRITNVLLLLIEFATFSGKLSSIDWIFVTISFVWPFPVFFV